jgi:PAS domain S-box-containing protein
MHRPPDTTILIGEEPQRETSLVQLLLAVAAAANNATTVEEGMQVCLDEVCAHMGWPIGHLYLVSSSTEGRLVSTSTWHLERPELFTVFRRGTEALDLERGPSLVGRVLASGKPVWVTNVSKDSDFARRREALENGIRSAFAFPVLIGREVVAVLEFFSQDEVEPDEPLLEVMANIGAQLGRVVERARAEQALKESEQEKLALLQSTDLGIYGIDEQGLCTFINRAGALMLGYSPEELLGENMHELIHHSHADGFPYPVGECPIFRACRTGEGCHIDEEVLWKRDGTSFPAEYSSHPIRKGNVVNGAVVSFTDITKRKQAEEAVTFERYLLNSLMESTPDSIYFKDKNSKFTRINRALAAALNLTDPQEAIGKSDADFFSEALAIQSYNDEQEILRTGKPVVEKEELEIWPDGRKTWVLTTKMPLRDSGGHTIGTFGVSRDITQRKEAEEKLRTSERTLFQFIEAMPVGVFVLDSKGDVYYADRKAQQILGRGILPGASATHLAELYQAYIAGTDKIYPAERMPVVRALSGETSTITDMEIHRPDGIVPLEVSAAPIYDAQGAVAYAIATFTDITERKLGEEALSKLAAIVESSNDAIVGKSLDGVILSWNPSAERLYGYSAEEVMGHSISIVIPPDRTAEAPTILDRIRRGERVESYETVRQCKDGRLINVSLTVSPIRDKLGNIVGASATARDITERKRAEAALRESERRFQLAARATNDVLWDWDIMTGHLWFNQGLRTQFGYDYQEVQYHIDWWSGLLHPDDQQRIDTSLQAAIDSQEQFWSGEYQFRRADASYADVLDRGYLVYNDDGQAIRMIGSMMDITERKRAQIELAAALNAEQAANEELDRLNKLKGEFVSIVSHEFRTALTGIQGFSEMMRDEDFSMQEMKEFAADINKDSQRLNRMISELLDLDRMESGRMALNLESVDLNDLIDHVANLSRRKAEGHQISLKLSDDVPPLLGDRDKLTQVLFNLLNNAIKYSPAGGITITSSAEKGLAHVQVEDRGIGIPKEALERVFDRYSRIESEKSRHIQGTGLGLPIARQIVEMHGGKIWAESTPGSGSIFHFTIPIAPSGASVAR